MKRFGRIFLSLVLLAVFLLAGCDGGEKASSVKDTISFMGIMKGDNLDPINSKSVDAVAFSAIFDRLTRYKDDFSIAPNLAKSWQEHPDGVTVDFNLRDDVYFHDGTKMTADDVLYSFNQAFESPVISGAVKQRIAGAEKLDELTIRVVKSSPHVNLLTFLASSIYMIPQDYHSKNQEAFQKKPIGTGAYKLDSIELDGSLVMSAHKKYFHGEPKMPNLIVRPPLDPSAALMALEAGTIDFLPRVSEIQFKLVEDNEKLHLVKQTGYASMMVFLGGPVLSDDVYLRKAIFHAINPESVMMMASEGEGEINRNVFAGKLMGQFDGVTDYHQYDPQMAKEALGLSNYDGSAITITAEAGTAVIAQAIQGDLHKAGIKAEIEQLDMNSYMEKVMSGGIQIEAYQLGSPMLAFADILGLMTTEGDYDDVFAGKSPQFDSAVKNLTKAVNATEAKKYAKEALDLLYERYSLFGLYSIVTAYAHNDTITNIPTHSAATYVYYFHEIEGK